MLQRSFRAILKKEKSLRFGEESHNLVWGKKAQYFLFHKTGDILQVLVLLSCEKTQFLAQSFQSPDT